MSNFDAAKRFEEIMARLEAEDKAKRDVVVTRHDINIRDDGGVEIGGLGRVGFTPYGFQKFNRLLGIPVPYAERCLGADPSLWADHARYWLANNEEIGDREFLFRAKERSHGMVVRGILSPKYREIDDFPAMDWITMFSRGTGAYPEAFYQSDDFMHLRLTFPGMRRSLGKMDDGVTDDFCFPGIHIVNSEVGRSAFRVELFIHRLVCSNGLVVQNREFRIAQRHYGPNVDIPAMLNDAIVRVGEAYESYAEKARAAKGIEVEPEKEIATLADRFGWTMRQRKGVEAAWADEPGRTRRHIVEAITAAARNFGWIDRLEMERQAAQVLGV